MGAKRVTSQDVARKAGVSRTTVSFVLNNAAGIQISPETRERVLQIARDLGYVPDAAAQALARGRSQTIGLLLARRSRLIASDMFLIEMMEVLVREISRNGMHLLLEVVEDFDNPEAYLKLVRSNSIDGVIYSGPRFNDAALRWLVDHGVPTVLMGALQQTPYPYVDIDNRKAAQMAVTHLLRMGHLHTACITNAPLTYVAAADRLQGYRDALYSFGIPFEKRRVRYGDFSPESGYEQMKSLLEEKMDLSAVFVASDVVAFGAMTAIRECGLFIPGDIALVGFDDVPVARFVEPSLTTVQLPVMELAQKASEMIVQLVHEQQPACSQVLLEANLLVRKSCGGSVVR